MPFGYLHVDHRNSPGMTESQARAVGYDPTQVKEGKVFEADTYKCCGCRTHVMINPGRLRERAWCRRCGSYMCDNCAVTAKVNPSLVHTPIAQVIDAVTSGKYTWEIGPDGLAVLNRKDSHG